MNDEQESPFVFGNGEPLNLEAIRRMIARTREKSRTRRIDCWMEVGDGHYRLKLGRRLFELEEKINRGAFQIYGSVARGRYEQNGESFGFATEGAASRNTCREVVRLGLVGGGQAVIDGRLVQVDGPAANKLLARYIDDGPAELLWDMAFAIMSCAIEGREMTEAEKALPNPHTDVIPPVSVDEPA